MVLTLPHRRAANLHSAVLPAAMLAAIAALLAVTPRATAETPEPQSLTAPFDRTTAKSKQAEWARFLKSEVVVKNSIAMKLVLVPPGEFMM
jgi:hypothetical protein